MQVGRAHADELGDAHAGGVQHSIIARSRRPSGVETSGCAMQRVDLLERQKLRQRGHARGGRRSSAGLLRQRAVEHEEAVEAADGGDARATERGDRPAARCCADERLERRRDRALGGHARRAAPAKRASAPQIARVALERVRGQPPLDAQMIEEARSTIGDVCYYPPVCS